MRFKLVIVDDNPADRAMLRRMLHSCDMEVDLVEIDRANDFLTMAYDDVDCAMIDFRLPDSDGIDALAEVCRDETFPPCPVIIMSGHGDEHTAARAFKAGANDYLVKDNMTPNGLKRTLMNAMEKWHGEAELRSDREMQQLALRDAERANRAKTQFISSLSHQLRVPLTAIIGFSDVIQSARFGDDEDAWEKYKVYAGDITRSARDVLDLVGNLVELAGIENGDVPISTTSFDPRLVLKEVMDEYLEAVNDGQINLRIDDESAPRKIRSDDRAVSQIMSNLVSNAIKFTPAGQDVSVQLSEVDGGKCRFSVADTGIGMNPADVVELTKPFERYRMLEKGDDGQIGLGLPLVNSLVRTLGGDLSFDTEPGAGTTAIVILPNMHEDADVC